MTKGRPGRQQRKDHRPQTSSIDGSGLASLPADALRRRVDKILQVRHARDLKLKEQGKFEFLKSGLGPPAPKSDASATTTKRIAQAKRLKISDRDARALQFVEILDTCNQVEQMLSNCIRCASTGDPIMLNRLVAIAVHIIRSLDEIVINTPEVVHPISRNLFFWPGLIGRKRSLKQSNERLIKLIQLGAGDKISMRGWQISAPSTKAAFDLFLTAHDFQRDWNLPPLKQQNKKKWFEVAWQQMLNDRIFPEAIPWLAPVGKSAIGKRSISRGMSKQTEGMKRDDVRAEIKRQVWNAFEKLVAGASQDCK
jgi:hypothetical protein